MGDTQASARGVGDSSPQRVELQGHGTDEVSCVLVAALMAQGAYCRCVPDRSSRVAAAR